jgi:hypothetical protein
MVGRKGATWPNQGLPRGTPSLVYWLCVKSFGMSPGVEPATSQWVKDRQSRASQLVIGWFLLYDRRELYLN